MAVNMAGGDAGRENVENHSRLIADGESISFRLDATKRRIFTAMSRRSTCDMEQQVILVAVSKTKPPKMIIEAYERGQRHFGENYVEELLGKANDPEIVENCADIKWHFIGHLQSNKIKKLLSVPNLYVLETVDSKKLATALHSAWMQQQIVNDSLEPLRVMIQVNTSGEKNKSGVTPDEVVDLAMYIQQNCCHLKLFGFMTIGMERDNAAEKNPDFLCLWDCRLKVCEELDLIPRDLELSMGMTYDFEYAIELGSTSVRIGSGIFGSRNKK